MRVFELPQRPISHHGSAGMTVWPLRASAPTDPPPATHVVVVHLDAGGSIGRHPAASWQLFVVTSGEGRVSGGDGPAVPVCAGQAALWAPGEQHHTMTESGLTAAVLETASEPDLAGFPEVTA